MGAGRMLLEWACEKADAENMEIFVEVNTWALPFYEKFGFEVHIVAEMPGGFGYTDYIMIRQPNGRFTFKDEVDGHLREGVHEVAPDGRPAIPRAESLGTVMSSTPQLL